MQVALSRNGVIYNIIEAQSVAAAQALFPDAVAFDATGLGIGWTYANGIWTAPAPQPAPVKTRISKYDLIMRLTDTEADTLLADFNDAPGKLALLWNSIMYVDQNDPSYPILQNVIVNRLGATRGAEVLAPME